MKKNILKALALTGMLSTNMTANIQQRIAVADINSLVQSSDYANEVAKIAKDKQDNLQKLMMTLSQELDACGKKLTERFKAEDLGALAEAHVQNELVTEKKIKEATFEKERLYANLEVEKASTECKAKIEELASAYGKQHGFDIVLDKKNGVLFCNTDLDITENVKKHIAEEYKKEKRKSGLLASLSADKIDKKDAVHLAAAAEATKTTAPKAA